MLNPSTADADVDDHTIRKCIGLAQRWGFSGITVVNLYALRSTDPSRILERPAQEAIGDRNLLSLHAIGKDIEALVCAWGCESVTRRLPNYLAHAEQCIRFLSHAGNFRPQQLGPPTKTGEPRHPLMAPYASPRIPFDIEYLISRRAAA